MTEVLDLQHEDDPRDVVHRAVERLVGGQTLLLPGESCYVLGALATQAGAVEAIAEPPNPLPVLVLRSMTAAFDYVPGAGPVARRIMRRCWPGPVILEFEESETGEGLSTALPEDVRRRMIGEGVLRLFVPAHVVAQEVLRLLPAPLAGWCIRGSDCGECLNRSGFDPAVALDAGAVRFPKGPTRVRIDGAAWRVIEEGAVSRTMVQRATSEVFLFVCTGNTCRSPMAAAVFRKLLAERLECGVDELAEHGFVVESAGLSAAEGSPASPEAVEVGRSLGLDLSDHTSQPLTNQLADHSDHLITMTQGHRAAILESRPDLADRVRLLSEEGEDVSDPIGGTREQYASCLQEIERNLRQMLDGMSFSC